MSSGIFIVSTQHYGKWKMNCGLHFDLTAETRPTLIRAGTYSIADHAFETEYRLEQYHALHLYHYTCQIRMSDGQTIRISPGDVTITPCGHATRYALEEAEGQHWCVHFQLPPGNGLFIPFLTKAQLLTPLFTTELKELTELFANEESPYSLITAENLLLVLLARLQRATRTISPPDPRILRLQEYLDRYSHQKIAVAPLARRFGMSQTHLTRKFKAHTQLTIAEYVMRQRLDRACCLLASSNLSIKEIGQIVGYSTPQEFNKRFRRRMGMSPGAFRAGT